MRRLVAGILAALGVLVAGGCGFIGLEVAGSGFVVEQTYEVQDFDMVSAGYGFSVDVSPGSAYTVSVRTDDNILPYVIVRQAGDRLEITLQTGVGWYRPTDLRAFVTLPGLTGMELSGGSTGYVAPGFATSGIFAVSLSGGSEASVGALVSGGLAVDLSGGSSLSGEVGCGQGPADLTLSGGSRISRLKGEAAVATLDSSGSGVANLDEFKVQTASATLSGGSEARVSVRASLNVDLSGGSSLEYRRYTDGPTIVGLAISGGSEITMF